MGSHWWQPHQCGLRGLLLLGAVGGSDLARGLASDGRRRLLGAQLAAALGVSLLAPASIVALQPRAAAALVAVEAGQVVEATALLAESLPPALPDDAVNLRNRLLSGSALSSSGPWQKIQLWLQNCLPQGSIVLHFDIVKIKYTQQTEWPHL